MCEYCCGGINTIELKGHLNVDVCGDTIRVMSYPEEHEDGTCIYIKRKFCHECGRDLNKTLEQKLNDITMGDY